MEQLVNQITKGVTPELIEAAKVEMEALAEQGKMHIARDQRVRELQYRVYAKGLQLRYSTPMFTAAYEENELEKIIRQERRVSRLLVGSDSIYADISGTSPDTKQTAVVRHLFETFHYSGKRNILILGGVGSGKTYGMIAYAGSQASVRFAQSGEMIVNAVFIRAYSLSEAIQRKSWEKLAEIRSKKWLMIDDLGIEGAGYKSADFLAFFEDLFIERHQTQKHTLITSNATIQEVKDVFGDRFLSRLTETGEVFQTADPDMRRNANV